MSPPQKSCAVCGDKALGYNFNAVTCESCKAFFRRNALAKKHFTCPFNQNCEITVVTRRFCQKCRLKKCLDIGMNSENIMSEEDKLIKRRKIENNRAKRRQNGEQKLVESTENVENDIEKPNQKMDADSSGADIANFDSQSCASFDSGSNGINFNEKPSSSKSSRTESVISDLNIELMTSEEMVEFIVADPDKASQAISKLMRTPAEAISTLDKILNSQKDALKLISHLIAYPGDGLKIISKIMNSPFNALTVFTKFMSSPTDALELISKVVSSPQDVLNFIKNLMDSPEDALSIMNKFMNTPAEALKIINKLFNGSNSVTRHENDSSDEISLKDQNVHDSNYKSPASPSQQTESADLPPPKGENAIIYSMLNNSPSEAQVYLTPINAHLSSPIEPTVTFTPSHQLTSPISVTNSDLPYNSPTTSLQNDELPSTSAGLIAASPTNITNDSDFIGDQFDIKAFMQNTLNDNTTNGDSMNSFESVLSEVIRIEFQAFNNLPPEPRVKQEMYTLHTMQTPNQGNFIGCYQKQHLSVPQEDQHHAQYQTQQHNVICSPSSVNLGRDLNDTEQTKLRELKLASEALYYPLDDDMTMLMMNGVKPEESNQYQNLLQVINLTAVAIKRLIKMAKKISSFRDMCQEDQVALLKGGCTEMMLIRSVMTYDDNRNIWKIPHTIEAMTNVNAEILKLAKGNLYEEHLNFIRTFDEKWRLDENIILIMCAIVLFTPSRPRIIHSDVITLEQNSYYYLLRRYLESVYPGCEAKSTFMKLIKKISDVERLNRTIIGVYLNVNPAEVEPLLREIFDLKNH